MGNYKIKYGDSEFDASEYQEKIFEYIEKGKGNLVINAAAGSAKTTTLVNCINYVRKGKKILCVAFNKHIAEELKRKIENPLADARTCSSVGFEILRENGIGRGENAVNDDKYTNYIRQNINSISKYKETKSLGINHVTYMRNIHQLVDLCRYTLAFTPKEISKLAEKYGIVPVRDEIDVCRQVLIWGKDNVNEIDRTDMVWLPCVLNLNTKRLIKDYVFIDEAQDITLAQQTLIFKCFARGARFVAVGDENQQINVWCGSDEAAIDAFKNVANTSEMALPICYRCGTKIVELAKNFSNNIVAAPNAIDGEINYDTEIGDIKSGDMVLCRITYPLVELQQELYKRNKKAYMQGAKEIQDDYLSLIDGTHSKKIDRNCITSDGMFPMLYMSLFDEIKRVMTAYNMKEEEAIVRPSVLYMYDNIEALKVLSEGLTTVEELKEKIKFVFGGSPENAILLSTIHKAKGLEADRVFIYRPSLLTENKLAKKDWEFKTERHLEYVAYTRPKQSLNFMKERKTNIFNNPYSSNALKMEFEKIKRDIQYNKDAGIKEEDVDTTTSVKKIIGDGMYINTNISTSKQKKVKGGLKFWDLM